MNEPSLAPRLCCACGRLDGRASGATCGACRHRGGETIWTREEVPLGETPLRAALAAGSIFWALLWTFFGVCMIFGAIALAAAGWSWWLLAVPFGAWLGVVFLALSLHGLEEAIVILGNRGWRFHTVDGTVVGRTRALGRWCVEGDAQRLMPREVLTLRTEPPALEALMLIDEIAWGELLELVAGSVLGASFGLTAAAREQWLADDERRADVGLLLACAHLMRHGATTTRVAVTGWRRDYAHDPLPSNASLAIRIGTQFGLPFSRLDSAAVVTKDHETVALSFAPLSKDASAWMRVVQSAISALPGEGKTRSPQGIEWSCQPDPVRAGLQVTRFGDQCLLHAITPALRRALGEAGLLPAVRPPRSHLPRDAAAPTYAITHFFRSHRALWPVLWKALHDVA